MACACKSNNGAKKQASQIVKRSTTHTVSQSKPSQERKQIIIRRPAR